ncbi:MAG: NAD(P)H-hydrate epimerase, partial [Paracoccaceae bacterium]
MKDLLTAARMRAIETEAIESGAVTGLELMERAGAGVVRSVLEEWPELAEGAHRAIVLCGPGNNGGDGFVVARLLKSRGWEVAVFLFGDAARLPPDARKAHARWCEIGTVVRLRSDGGDEDLSGVLQAACSDGRRACVVFDALFGTGLTRPLGDLARLMQAVALPDDAARGGGFLRVAVDLPSGLCSDSGRVLDAAPGAASAFTADLTVTFHRMKPGHLLADGPARCGKVAVVDIGLPSGLPADPVRLAQADPRSLGKAGKLHKYGHGHAVIFSGGAGRSGAARLAARGALRVGAGLVTLGVPGSAQMECAVQVTAIMLRRVEDGAGLAAMLEDARLNALCLGPGLGIARARDLVPVALGSGGGKTHPARAVVLDADALTAFAEAPERLFGLLHEACVLTPHFGEFARLFPDLAERLQAPAAKGPAFSKLDACRAAAAR